MSGQVLFGVWLIDAEFLILFSDCSAEAFHFQVSFPADNNSGNDKDTNIHTGSIASFYLAHYEADEGINACEYIADGDGFIQRYSSIYHLVVDMAPV